MLRRLLHRLFPPTDSRKSSYSFGPQPNVILDVIFDRGLFFLSIHNIGDQPARRVSVRLDQPLLGLEGSKDISALPLFQNIEFLAPHKAIATFVDTSASYFSRGNPTQITAKIRYQDLHGVGHERMISHNLEIYKEVAYVLSRNEPVTSPSAAPSHWRIFPDADSTAERPVQEF